MQPDRDEDVADASDDDIGIPRNGRRGGATRRERDDAQNFEVTRTWDLLTEGEDGTITGAVEGLRESNKRKRLLKDTTPLQRGIIRHLILILDISVAMTEKDLRPTRYLLMLQYTTSFINEFFEQNPISQLGMIGMQDGIAVRISDLSGNPTDHLNAITRIRSTLEPKGNPSLENALEMSRASLFHAPSHGTREILLVIGALHSADPGDIHATISSLTTSHIRASVIGLAAQVAICAELVSKTNNGSRTNYHIAMHEQHFRELYLSFTTPPVTYMTPSSAAGKATNSLLMMGFPSRTVSSHPTLCACHTRPSRVGYHCSRCGTKVCSLPSECPVCGLTLILSTHLARSYHHLFPLVNWEEVPWQEAYRSSACFACGKLFPAAPAGREAADTNGTRGRPEASNTSSRYECPVCSKHFCIDCDLFAHEVVHNCPGCQSVKMETSLMGEVEAGEYAEGGMRTNGDATSARNGGNG